MPIVHITCVRCGRNFIRYDDCLEEEVEDFDPSDWRVRVSPWRLGICNGCWALPDNRAFVETKIDSLEEALFFQAIL